jgi:hypothetical protein
VVISIVSLIVGGVLAAEQNAQNQAGESDKK